MGWSSILRKFTKREQASLGSRDQGGPRWDESNPTVAEPSVAIGSNHGGDYDPNQKEKPLIDSHGGDYDPNQYNFTSSDRSKDHGGDYDPSLTVHNHSLEQRHQPGPAPSRGLNTEPSRSRRSRRRAHRDTATPPVTVTPPQR